MKTAWLRRGLAAGAACLCALFFLPLGSPAANAPSAASHATVQLIADGNNVQPGRTLLLGLLFRMDPGWHIYWQNPGDSGEPPKVRWALPAGLQAGALLWPRPVRLGHGSVVDYGYEGQALLIAPVRIAASARIGPTTRVSAAVNYLVCQDTCIPQKAQLTLSLPTKSSAQFSKWRDLFARTMATMPRPAPRNWKISAKSAANSFVLTVRTGKRESAASFFPLDPDVIENSRPQAFTATAGGFQLALRKSSLLAKPVSILRGLIVMDRGRAFVIAAPVSSQ